MRWGFALRLGLLIAAAGIGAAALRRGGGPDVIGRPVVVDGDSLRFAGRDVRLEAIDAPELRQTCRRVAEEVACGRDARLALLALIAGRDVACRLTGRDRYGRDLGRCRAGDDDLNAAMVRSGQAFAYGCYWREEAEARAARRGVWALTLERPADWRSEHPRPPGP